MERISEAVDMLERDVVNGDSKVCGMTCRREREREKGS